MFQVVPINMVQDVIMYDMSTRHIRYRELQFGCVHASTCAESIQFFFFEHDSVNSALSDSGHVARYFATCPLSESAECLEMLNQH